MSKCDPHQVKVQMNNTGCPKQDNVSDITASLVIVLEVKIQVKQQNACRIFCLEFTKKELKF